MSNSDSKAMAWAVLSGVIVFTILALLPIDMTEGSLNFWTAVIAIPSLLVGVCVYNIKK